MDGHLDVAPGGHASRVTGRGVEQLPCHGSGSQPGKVNLGEGHSAMGALDLVLSQCARRRCRSVRVQRSGWMTLTPNLAGCGCTACSSRCIDRGWEAHVVGGSVHVEWWCDLPSRSPRSRRASLLCSARPGSLLDGGVLAIPAPTHFHRHSGWPLRFVSPNI